MTNQDTYMGEGTEFAERCEQIMEWTGWSAREWARRAGLPEVSHINTLLRRVKLTDKLTVDVSVVGPMAKSAGFSLDWLVTGRGHPTGALTNLDDARYPSRGRVVATLRFLDFPGSVIDSLVSENGFADDPGIEYWLDRARVERSRVRAQDVKVTGRQKRRRAR